MASVDVVPVHTCFLIRPLFTSALFLAAVLFHLHPLLFGICTLFWVLFWFLNKSIVFPRCASYTFTYLVLKACLVTSILKSSGGLQSLDLNPIKNLWEILILNHKLCRSNSVKLTKVLGKKLRTTCAQSSLSPCPGEWLL